MPADGPGSVSVNSLLPKTVLQPICSVYLTCSNLVERNLTLPYLR